MKYVYGRKKWLAAGIAALLISGTGAVSDVLAAAAGLYFRYHDQGKKR